MNDAFSKEGGGGCYSADTRTMNTNTFFPLFFFGVSWWCRKMSAVVLGYHYVKMRYDHDEVYILPPACAG